MLEYSNRACNTRRGERRIGPERRGGLFNYLVAYIVRLGGAKTFQGIQRGDPKFNLPALVLFDDSHGSTLAVPLHELSADRVRRALSESKERWEKSVVACESLVRELENTYVEEEVFKPSGTRSPTP